MCGIARQVNPLNSLLGHSTFRKLDPTLGNLEDWDAKKFGAPTIPTPTQPQEVKMPDAPVRRRERTGNTTMLTGSQGVTASSLNTGGTTLLGG